MSAEIEPEAIVLDCLRNSANLRIGLEDDAGTAACC